MRILFFFSLLFITFVSVADYKKPNKTLRYEVSPPIGPIIQFDHDDPLLPNDSDFDILDQRLMSNDLGERWALLTLVNTASGLRILDRKDIVATFADGHQTYAQIQNHKLKPGQIYSQTVFFGHYTFPLARIDVSNSLNK